MFLFHKLHITFGSCSFSPVLMVLKQVNGPRTPGKSKHARGGLMERNKENLCPPQAVSGALMGKPLSPQPNASINSVASTYSEFAVIGHSFLSAIISLFL